MHKLYIPIKDYRIQVTLMSEETPSVAVQKVRFIYKQLESAEPIYINGVQGGMSGRGELIANFFFEYRDAPEEEINHVKDDKIIFDKPLIIFRDNPEKGEIVVKRDIRVRLIIPAQQISSIANWMIDALKASSITVEKKEPEKSEK